MNRKTMVVVLLAGLVVFSQPVAHANGARIENGSSVHLMYFLEANGVSVIPAQKKAEMALIVGRGTHPAAFEKQLIGLKKGDTKNIEITPDQGFGPYRQELMKRVPKDQLPPTIPLKEGLMLSGKNGQRPIRIAKVLDDSVVLDANHPFAGKTLDYHVQVTDVE